MITFIFIAITLVLIYFINLSIRDLHIETNLSKKEEDELIQKKTGSVFGLGVVFIVFGVIFINFSGYFKTAEEIQISEDKRIEDSIQKSIDSIVSIPPAPLTPQEQFLEDNGFKTDADFTESQFNEFKSIIESGVFKEDSFCDVFQKSLDITNNSKNPKADLKKLYSKYKKIPYIDTVVSMYGFQFCTPKPLNTENNSSTSYTNTDDRANPCIISEDFIKQDLQNPSTADFSMFDCSSDKNSDGTYTVLRKVSAENSFGVEKEFIYKVKIGFKGGSWVDMTNWDLINIQSEEYR